MNALNRSFPKPSPADCQGALHSMAVEGIHLFNTGKYWEAHEALEQAWLDEPGEIRHLYRGILQVGVAYLHVVRGNYPGALKLYRRCKRWLAPFPDLCRGVHVGRLKQDLEEVISMVRQLGPEKMAMFDRSLLRPVIFEPLQQ